MSKLEELIQQYCPDGVEYRPLWSLTAWDKKFNGIEDKSKQDKEYNWKTYKFAKNEYNLTKYCNNPKFGLKRFTDNLT